METFKFRIERTYTTFFDVDAETKSEALSKLDKMAEEIYEAQIEETFVDYKFILLGEDSELSSSSPVYSSPVYWARQCDITFEGMNEGWVVGDGDAYFKYEKDALEWATEIGYANLEEAYEDDAIYWTEWDDESDRQYVEINRLLIDVENLK